MRKSVISVIISAKDEAASIAGVIDRVRAVLPDAQLIVVDDGSQDATAELASTHGAQVIRHPESLGNGAAVKAGARAAEGDILVLLDADGQHPPEAIPQLLSRLAEGYRMVVGARDGKGQANRARSVANSAYNAIASWVTGKPVLDLTSGFRVADATRFREFLYLFPNGFSYPTTVTMAFFRSGYPVAYVPVDVAARVGRSHLRPLRDGVRFLLIIFKVATLYSPLKIFLPASAVFGILGLGNYAYTYFTEGRFTNMSALLLSASVIVLLIGLLSEQITALMYRRSD